MITEPTAFILGAGASSSYGFPLGDKLRELIISRLLDPKNNDTGMYLLDSTKYTETDLKCFANDLRKARHTSIDAFLALRQDLAEIGKLAITVTLIPLENEEDLYPEEDDWARWLINHLLSQMDYDNGIRINSGMVHIYTFNYDRSFEKILFDMIIAKFPSMKDEGSGIISHIQGLITHIHGLLGSFINGGDYGRAYTSKLPDNNNLLKIAESIVIPHEFNNRPRDFEIDNYILSKMVKIYFLGFGYHSDILQWYMPAFEGDKRIYGTAKCLSPG